LMPATSIRSQLLQLLIDGKSEIQLYGLRRSALKIVDEMSTTNWGQIAKYVSPSELSNGVDTFKRYQKFLEARVGHMPALINDSLGLKQGEMFPLMDSGHSRKEQ
ncbi:MAG TPA: hypothetical protein VEF04_13590, partial [Blastocatellia bacterium]|nr:hypothetical protein [Blastocatellia bacterium]